MPAEVKTTERKASGEGSLEGTEFVFKNERERILAIDQAFDYRGDVTLTLADGTKLEGFMFNRDVKARPPRIEMFIKGSEEPRVLPYDEVTAIAFTGKDTANGKSWRDWVTKHEGQREAEAERIRLESIERGEL